MVVTARTRKQSMKRITLAALVGVLVSGVEMDAIAGELLRFA